MELLLEIVIASRSNVVPFTALSAKLNKGFEIIPPIAVTKTQKIKATLRDDIPLIENSIDGYALTTSEASFGSVTTIIFITEM